MWVKRWCYRRDHKCNGIYQVGWWTTGWSYKRRLSGYWFRIATSRCTVLFSCNLHVWDRDLTVHATVYKNYIIHLNMRGIPKEMSRRTRNRNQYLYVRSIDSGFWGTCPTATQDGKWLSRKIPGAALWTTSVRTAWRRRPRRIIRSSEPF